MNWTKLAIILAGLAILVGCGQNKNGELTLEEMAEDDVVVQVNDNKLLKREMMRVWKLNCASVAQMKGMEKSEAERRIQQDIMDYAPRFVNQMLLVDDAKRHHVLTDEQLAAAVEKKIDDGAKAKKMTRQQFLTLYPDVEWFIRQTATTRIWINAHVASNIPPRRVVTPTIVSNYVALINAATEEVRQTNEAKRVQLETIRREVLSGKAVFTNVAAKVSKEDWDLGAIEKYEQDFDQTVRDGLFSAKVGDILPVSDELENYRLLTVAGIIPAETNKYGRMTQQEKRVVHQIVLPKEDYPIQMTYEQAAYEVAYQEQMKSIDARVEFLKTNGENRVVWPHGKNLWRKRK